MPFINFVADFLRTNSVYVAVAIVATAFAVYGIYLKRFLKKTTKKMNFFLRFVVYVFVYAFGLGFLSAQTVRLIERLLINLNNFYLVLIVCLSFLILCFLAKNEKQI